VEDAPPFLLAVLASLDQRRGMRYVLWCLIAAVYGSSAMAGDEYIPLTVGDEWTMASTSVSPTGQVSEGVARRKIEGSVEKGGKTYFRSRTWTESEPAGMEHTELVRMDAKAYYSIDEKKPDAVEQIIMVLPLKIGATWQRTLGSMTATETVIGLETVEISGKVYENCYHIRLSTANGHYTENFWQAPNVGNVKDDVVYGNGLKMSCTLNEFKPGK
jgi:hypothetical protein